MIHGLLMPNTEYSCIKVVRVVKEEEPVVCVNPKQYGRILKRRAARDKLVREGRIPPPGERRSQ